MIPAKIYRGTLIEGFYEENGTYTASVTIEGQVESFSGELWHIAEAKAQIAIDQHYLSQKRSSEHATKTSDEDKRLTLSLEIRSHYLNQEARRGRSTSRGLKMARINDEDLDELRDAIASLIEAVENYREGGSLEAFTANVERLIDPIDEHHNRALFGMEVMLDNFADKDLGYLAPNETWRKAEWLATKLKWLFIPFELVGFRPWNNGCDDRP